MAGDMEFGWQGGQDPATLTSQLEAFDAALDRRLFEAMEELGLRIEASARRKVPVDNGRLRGSLSNKVQREGASTIALYVGTNVQYAEAVEYGRGPISASGDGVLHFTIDGEEIFVKSVGPAPAQPYLRPAITQHRSTAEDLIQEAVEDAARDAGLS